MGLSPRAWKIRSRNSRRRKEASNFFGGPAQEKLEPPYVGRYTVPVLQLAWRISELILFLIFAGNAGWGGPVELTPQLITLPANAGGPLFVDIDGDGRSDLLVIDPLEQKLLRYRQRPDGFTNSPDQVIPLPPQTAWVAACDVDANPGLELLISTAKGLVYSRQKAGLFELEWRTLIEANQVFTNNDWPILASLNTNKKATNDSIPVIHAGRTVLYHRDGDFRWNPDPPQTLQVKQSAWSTNRDDDEWTLGANPAHSLGVQKAFRLQAEKERGKEPDNEGIRKIMGDMKKTVSAGPPRTNRVDLDGDGREDLVLWQVSGKLDVKTDVYVFLRGADQRLPERPTQILHCRGFPIPIGSTTEMSAVGDLNGDGVGKLVLLELKTPLTSPSGLFEIALSHALNWVLTIRTFRGGAFSGSPDVSVPVTTLMGAEDLREWPICINGDFNGDGRPDLLVRFSETQWNILFSTMDGRWFAPQPAMAFTAPAHGFLEIKDLNRDGSADIIWHETEEARLSIFMSPPPRAKGKNP